MLYSFIALATLTNSIAPLDLPAAQELALREHPYVESRRLAQAAADEAAVAASALPDPRLKLSVINVPVDSWSVGADPMTQRMISVEQMVPGGAKRRLRGDVAGRESERARADLSLARLELRRGVARAWLDAYRQAQTVKLIELQQETLRQQVDAAKIAYRAGKIGQDLLFAARVSLDRLTERAADAKAQVRRARGELFRWVGRDAERELGDLPALDSPPTLSDLEARIPSHPEVRVMDAQVAQSQAQAALAREARKPDWAVELGYGRRAPVFGDMVSAQVAIDLPIFPANRQDRTAAAARAQAERLEREREDLLRRIDAELARYYSEWEATETRLRTLDEETLPDAQARVQAALAAYGVGSSPLTALLDARNSQLEIRLERLTQETARVLTRAELAYFEGEAP